jgi:cysteine desulfuration protein SufE
VAEKAVELAIERVKCVFPVMSLSEKQQRLIAKYAIIEDAQERLGAIVSRGKKWPVLANEERTEVHRVKGCVSQVWIAGEWEGDRCRFRMDGDSPLVKGLVAMHCELYDGESAEEIVATEPAWVEALGLEGRISPTRLNGLASVREAIREFAAGHLPK